MMSIFLTSILLCSCQITPKGYDMTTTYRMHEYNHIPSSGHRMIYRIDCWYCAQEKLLDGSSNKH